jgi:DNA-binding SARP family transcriptional activator
LALNGVASFRLITLGTLRLVDQVGRDAAHGQRKLLALLAYLARRSPRAVTREELAALMWGERPEENARASLRQALFQLKRTLGDVLDVTPESATLRIDDLDFDAAALEIDVASGRFREAALRWNGEFLQGAEDSGGETFRVWLESERARLRRLLSRALDALTSDAAARGAWAEAVTWAERWSDALPLEERPLLRLVELLSFAGRTVEALARHSGYVARVRTEYGVAPSEEFLRFGKQLERRVRDSASRLSGKAEDRASDDIRPSEMVGREAAFAQLTSAWHEARRGRATVVVVEGDAGVGKTRLAEEFLRTVEPRGSAFVVLRARAYDPDREVRLALARELLAPLRDAPGLLGAPRAALAELARLVPSVQEQIRDLPGPSDYVRALDEAVARILADVSAEAPVVVFVDDLPRTDPESRRLVLSLARRLQRDARVLMLLTARSGELGRPDELRDLRGLRQLKLKPLELADVEALVSSMLTLSTDARRLLAERLAAESGGVPFVIVEKVGAMVDEGQIVQDVNGVWQLASTFDAKPSSRGDFVIRALTGRYTTEGVLAKGGVLTTFAAFDARAGRQVELHVPNRRVAAATEADHFMRTFERVAALNHPGIIPVVDYGATGGVLFFATPRVEGAPLRDRIERERPLALDESVRIAADVGRALAHAHARGVHHRDLRPKHIIVAARGILVARLGLADALAASSTPDREGPDDTGVLIGAPAYLSPEQLAGEITDGARSDIYSVGCVLYEMLTGEPPFGGRGRGLIARKLTEPAPSVRNIRDGVPDALDQLVRRCLARMPADRYPSADDLADALDRVRATLSRRESPARVAGQAVQISDS